MHLRNILRIVRIDQDADCRQSVACADLLPGEGVAARPIDDREHVMILIDHDHRHEALARIGQRDRHRSGIEVEHTHRIECVAVAALDDLVVDWRQFAEVLELAEAARLRTPAKVLSVSARMKLSAVTGAGSGVVAFVCVAMFSLLSLTLS